MKKTIYLIIFLAILAYSCSTSYQVSQTNSDSAICNNGEYKYDSDDLSINYNLWKDGGALSFTIYNKSDKPIFLDWENSNFIWNDYSIDYYKELAITQSIGAGVKDKNNYFYNGFSILTKEKPQVQLPPKSYITIKKFNLGMPFIKRMDNQITYTKDNSILKFRNYLAYSFNKNLTETKYIDNAFWIEEIILVKKKDFKNNQFAQSETKNDKFYTSHKKIVKSVPLILGGIGGGIGIIFLLANTIYQ